MYKIYEFLPLLCILLMSCSQGRQNRDWDIDYSSVYRAYEGRQNDNSYKAPTVIGCVDDDLYNCR